MPEKNVNINFNTKSDNSGAEKAKKANEEVKQSIDEVNSASTKEVTADLKKLQEAGDRVLDAFDNLDADGFKASLEEFRKEADKLKQEFPELPREFKKAIDDLEQLSLSDIVKDFDEVSKKTKRLPPLIKQTSKELPSLEKAAKKARSEMKILGAESDKTGGSLKKIESLQVASALGNVISSAKSTGEELFTVTERLRETNGSFSDVSDITLTGASSVLGFASAIKTARLALGPVGVALAVVSTALAFLSKASKKASERAKAIGEEYKKTSAKSQKELDALIKKHGELEQKQVDVAEELRKRFIQNGLEVESVQKVIGKLESRLEFEKTLTNLARERAILEVGNNRDLTDGEKRLQIAKINQESAKDIQKIEQENRQTQIKLLEKENKELTLKRNGANRDIRLSADTKKKSKELEISAKREDIAQEQQLKRIFDAVEKADNAVSDTSTFGSIDPATIIAELGLKDIEDFRSSERRGTPLNVKNEQDIESVRKFYEDLSKQIKTLEDEDLLEAVQVVKNQQSNIKIFFENIRKSEERQSILLRESESKLKRSKEGSFDSKGNRKSFGSDNAEDAVNRFESELEKNRSEIENLKNQEKRQAIIFSKVQGIEKVKEVEINRQIQQEKDDKRKRELQQKERALNRQVNAGDKDIVEEAEAIKDQIEPRINKKSLSGKLKIQALNDIIEDLSEDGASVEEVQRFNDLLPKITKNAGITKDIFKFIRVLTDRLNEASKETDSVRQELAKTQESITALEDRERNGR